MNGNSNDISEFERLPVELGWRRKDEEAPLSAIIDLMEKLSNASSLFTGKSPLLDKREVASERIDLHGGFGFAET